MASFRRLLIDAAKARDDNDEPVWAYAQDMAEALGVSPNTLALWMRGKSHPRGFPATFAALAALGIDGATADLQTVDEVKLHIPDLAARWGYEPEELRQAVRDGVLVDGNLPRVPSRVDSSYATRAGVPVGEVQLQRDRHWWWSDVIEAWERNENAFPFAHRPTVEEIQEIHKLIVAGKARRGSASTPPSEEGPAVTPQQQVEAPADPAGESDSVAAALAKLQWSTQMIVQLADDVDPRTVDEVALLAAARQVEKVWKRTIREFSRVDEENLPEPSL